MVFGLRISITSSRYFPVGEKNELGTEAEFI
jgi:hypothetical protein